MSERTKKLIALTHKLYKEGIFFKIHNAGKESERIETFVIIGKERKSTGYYSWKNDDYINSLREKIL